MRLFAKLLVGAAGLATAATMALPASAAFANPLHNSPSPVDYPTHSSLNPQPLPPGHYPTYPGSGFNPGGPIHTLPPYLPVHNPPVYYPPISHPVFPQPPRGHDFPQPPRGHDWNYQGHNYNWQSSENNWYDPTQNDWYYPVTGWTGGHQDSNGCWSYPTHPYYPVTLGYQDNYGPQGWGNGHYGYDNRGNYGHSHGYGSYGYQGNHSRYITFEFPRTYGAWLFEISGPILHNGEVLTYDGQTYYVTQWNPNGNGQQGYGLYFDLTHFGGGDLQGANLQLGTAHTV